MQIIAQLPTQYVQSTPHNKLNVKLFEMTHSTKTLVQEHRVPKLTHVQKHGQIASAQRLCRSLKNNANLRFRTTPWQELDNKQVFTTQDYVFEKEGCEAVGNIQKKYMCSVNQHLMPFP